MDYIREELLRQGKLFHKLLSGGEEQQEEERFRQKKPQRAEEESLTQAERTKTLLPMESQRAAGPGTDADSQTAQRRGTVGEWEMLQRAARRTQRTVDTGMENGNWLGSKTASIRKEETAKALSRTFERDARRYDGGYPLY